MKASASTFEINFFEKDLNSQIKEPVRFGLTQLKNGCYTLSGFDTYALLHYVLTDWLQIHNKSQNLALVQNKYNKLIALNKQDEEILKHDGVLCKLVQKELNYSDHIIEHFPTEGNANEKKDAVNFGIQFSEVQIEDQMKTFKTVKEKNGDTYEGFIINGMRHGFGCSTMRKSGTRYIGQWKFNRYNGKGFMYYDDGTYYYGDWVNNGMNGQGEQSFSNGCLYIGAFKNGIREGYGVMTWVDGNSFRGYWKSDEMFIEVE